MIDKLKQFFQKNLYKIGGSNYYNWYTCFVEFFNDVINVYLKFKKIELK